MTVGWPRKIRRADRTARILKRDPLVVDFTSKDRRGSARARHDGEDEHGSWFIIEVRRLGIPKDLRIVPETSASLMWQRVKGDDVQIGDADFDAQVNLTGPPAWIVAALNVRAREHLTALLDGGGRVEAGRITTRLLVPRAFQLVAQSHQLLKLARRLSLPDLEVTQLLIRRARNATNDTRRRAAVAQLIQHAPFIAQHGDLVRVESLLAQGSAAEVEAGRQLRLAWLTGDPNRVMHMPEPVALSALDGPVEVRLAAIARLGQVGTALSIAPLTAASRGFFTSSRVKTAARAALEAVVLRVGEVAAGGLALTEDTRGHLAIKD